MTNSFEIEKGRVFVGGLHWQALSGGPSEVKSEAQQLAKQLSFDLAVWRTSGAQQVGFAAIAEGYAAGMLSAAAVVSKTIEVESGERDFLCATQLPDGRFLYVAQADGVIPPDGDVVGTSEFVRSRMLEDMSIGKAWSKVVAPVVWGIQDSTERPFVDFIPRKGGKLDFKHSWWALKPVKPDFASFVKRFLPVVIGAGLVALLLIGYKFWKENEAAKELARIAMLQTNEPPKEMPRPWEKMPRAQSAVDACIKGFDELTTLWPGNWKPEAVVCAPLEGTLTVNWRRGENGLISHLLEIEPKATISADGTMATLVLPLQVAGAEDEGLVAERTRTLQMQMATQQYGLNINITSPLTPPAMPGATGSAVLQPWRELAWSVKGGAVSPTAMIVGVDGPGLRVISVVARFSDGSIKWDLEGAQYVLP